MRRLSRERRLSVSPVLQALRQLEDRGLVEARPQSGYFVRHASARRAQPSVRSTPEEAVPVDVSQRLMRVLQTGVKPGVAPPQRRIAFASAVAACCSSAPEMCIRDSSLPAMTSTRNASRVLAIKVLG